MTKIANTESQVKGENIGDDYSGENLLNILRTQKDKILQVAFRATGLHFKNVKVEMYGKYNIEIDCTETDDDLGFFKNYIKSVGYDMKLQIVTKLNPDKQIWCNSGIYYEHHDHGHNGKSDELISIFYDWNKKDFLIVERRP